MIKKKLVYFLGVMFLIYLFVILVNGCATGPTYTPPQWRADFKKSEIDVHISIIVNSEPPGAKVYVNDAFVGVAPITVSHHGRAEKTWWERYLVSNDGAIIQTERKPSDWPGVVVSNYRICRISCPTTKITVYKEDYKRQEKHFDTSSEDIGRYVKNVGDFISYSISWTAFLEPDEKPFRLPVEIYPPSK